MEGSCVIDDAPLLRDIICVTLHAVIDDNFEVPGFMLGETQRAISTESFCVGKGISCAHALAGLGAAGNTHVVVICGAAEVPEYKSALSNHGFKSVHVYGGPPTTRRHVTIVDNTAPGNKAVTHIQVPGISHPPELFSGDGALKQSLLAICRSSTKEMGCAPIVGLSGSLPQGCPVTYYGTLITELKAIGVHALLDTSGTALQEGIQAGPLAVKPNMKEANELLYGVGSHTSTSTDEAKRSIVRLLLNQFPTQVACVSDGANGLFVSIKSTESDATPLPVAHALCDPSSHFAPIATDQGCGDSAAAALLKSFAQSPSDSSEIGTECLSCESLARTACFAASLNLYTPRPGHLLQIDPTVLTWGRDNISSTLNTC